MKFCVVGTGYVGLSLSTLISRKYPVVAVDVIEKKAKIWRKDLEGKNGPFYRYSVSVSKKMEDGTYINAYIPIKFSKKSGAPEKIPNGASCSLEGFMSVDSYRDKEGKQVNTATIIAMKVSFDGEDLPDSFEQAEEEIPF